MEGSKVIIPTVGRVMWYWPATGDDGVAVRSPDQPFRADVCFVHSDREVNVVVNDHDGQPHRKTNVLVRQEGDEMPANGDYCEWMPFQRGQAPASDSLVKRVGNCEAALGLMPDGSRNSAGPAR